MIDRFLTRHRMLLPRPGHTGKRCQKRSSFNSHSLSSKPLKGFRSFLRNGRSRHRGTGTCITSGRSFVWLTFYRRLEPHVIGVANRSASGFQAHGKRCIVRELKREIPTVASPSSRPSHGSTATTINMSSADRAASWCRWTIFRRSPRRCSMAIISISCGRPDGA